MVVSRSLCPGFYCAGGLEPPRSCSTGDHCPVGTGLEDRYPTACCMAGQRRLYSSDRKLWLPSVSTQVLVQWDSIVLYQQRMRLGRV